MRIKSLALLVFLMLALAPGILAAQPEDDAWINVGTGVDYRLFVIDGPVRVHVARMDRSNLDVTIESSIAAGRLAYGNETVSAMARRYDGALNYWNQDWGSTGKVLVAINGSYVEANGSTPQSGQITSGWYAKRFTNFGGGASGGSGFAWNMDRTPFIGGCVEHIEDKQVINFPAIGEKQNIDGVNTIRTLNKLVLYTPQYNSNTGTDNNGVEVLVEMTRPTLVLPPPASAIGYVRDIRVGQGSTIIPFDHVVLSASGSAADSLLSKVNRNDEIRISQEITHYFSDNDCNFVPSTNWQKTYTSISGDYFYLRDGQTIDFPGTPYHPRTAVAFNDDYIYFIVADGRAKDYSIGMTINELAAFTRNTLGAFWGIAVDGGGSSTMVINGQVVNRPSDPCYHIFLPHVTNQDGGSPPPFVFDPVVSFDRVNLACERRVGNGLMMVEVIAPEFSTAFLRNDPDEIINFSTRGLTNVRLGPGNNYPVIATLPPDARGGEILDPINGLEGVYAKDHYWWKVKWGNIEGWVIEDALREFASILPAWKYLR